MDMIRGLPPKTYVRDPYQKAVMPGANPAPGAPAGPLPGMEMPTGMAMPSGMAPAGVITPPPAIETPAPQQKATQEQILSAAIEVVNGHVVSQNENTVCSIDGQYIKDLKLKMNSDCMGGVYAAGKDTDLTLEHANIHISGKGTGLGGKLSGVYVEDGATLSLKDCRINMDGELRCATSAADHSVLKVYDSTLISHGEAWPADEERVTRVLIPKIVNPPYSLELEGNMRTHCTVGDSESYFYNSTIIADSWAALSTDIAGDRVYLEANDCKIITTRSGYGTYADGGCYVVLNRCDLNVASMAAICGGEAGVTLNDCTAKCGNYVVLAHVVGFGDGEALTHVNNIEIHHGSYSCEDAAILLKSCNADILLNNTAITSHAGVLLHSVYNDFCAPHPGNKTVYGIHTRICEMDAVGSIIHEDSERMMEVRLENSTLVGGITGKVYLALDEKSSWKATEDSNVVLVGEMRADQIDASAGITISAVGTENKELTLKSGGKLIMIAEQNGGE